MLSIDGSVRVYLAPGVTDMRKSIDTLTILVAEQMALDPLSGHLFAFCNRKRDTVKILRALLSGCLLFCIDST